MGINAGTSAITGVYLGDQLLTKGGGGSATENIQAAINAADTAELIHYMQGLETIAASQTAMQAIAASPVAMKEVAANQIVMSAVIASQTAMQAVTASSTAMQAVAASSTAMNVLYDHKKRLSGARQSISGKLIILEISQSNTFSKTEYGYAMLSDNSTPNWGNYRSKYAYFRKFKKYCTYIKNDAEYDDWVDYYEIK